MLNKLFAKLNITSTHQFILVNIVFAITGTLSVLLAGPMMDFFGIGSSSYGEIVYWVIRIFLIFLFYQCLLVIVSIPFGQFAYFRDVQKKMLAKCGVRF